VRRPVFLYVLLLAAPALGVELARPSLAPVQLSLSFAAPVAAPLISPALAAPLPALAVSLTAAPSPAAVAAAPAAAFSLAPALAAARPPELLPAAATGNEGEDGRSQLKRLASAAGSSGTAFDSPRRATKMDYEEFGRQVAARPGLSLDPFQHADAKRRILAASGYTHLFGAGGRRVPLAEASDVRVGKAFLSVKRTFDRRP
jgi:hypothetical protein